MPCYNVNILVNQTGATTMRDIILTVFFFAIIGVLLALGV